MKKLKLFLTGILATCVAVTGANAACTTDAESAAASITKDGAETKYCETVKDAVTTAQAGDTVHLLRNYKFTGNTTADRIEINKSITFDFGEYTITINNLPTTNGGLVVTGSGTKVTFVGKGGIARTNGSSALLVTSGAEVYINGGTFTQSGVAADGKSYNAVDVVGSTLVVEEKDGNKVTITGGIGLGGDNSVLKVNSGTITAEDFAVNGNGTSTTNSTIIINGGTLKSTGNAAIYHPQTGNLTITGGEIEGLIGIVARQGNVKIDGGKITATGTGEGIRVGDACENGKECTPDSDANYVKLPQGVAVIVDNHVNGAYTVTATAIVTKGEFEVPEGKTAVLDYENYAAKNIRVDGGKFTAGGEADTGVLAYTLSLTMSENGVIGTLHNITSVKPENGSIDVPENAAEGEVVTIAVVANEGYKVSKVYVNGVAVEADANGNYTFTMGKENVKVTAEFTKVAAESAPAPDDETTEETEENPNTLDSLPLYLIGGTVAVLGVAGLGYSIKKKFEN